MGPGVHLLPAAVALWLSIQRAIFLPGTVTRTFTNSLRTARGAPLPPGPSRTTILFLLPLTARVISLWETSITMRTLAGLLNSRRTEPRAFFTKHKLLLALWPLPAR